MDELIIKDDFIKLGQALKLANLVGSGVEAKIEIISDNVLVNGEVCNQRGKKLYEGDIFEFNNIKVKVVK